MTNFEISIVLFCFGLVVSSRSLLLDDCIVFSRSGDLSIGGVFPFRYSSSSLCGQQYGVSYWAVRSAEAMIWAIEEINARDDILPNITLGYQIRDDCGSEDFALWSTLSFYFDTCSAQTQSNPIGIIGGAWSSTAVWMAKVGNLFQVPLLSFSATSDELSDTVRFPYFFRTIPPDRFQVGAIMDILLKFNWRYIALIYSTDTYGIHGGRQIRSAAETSGVCIALSASIQPYAPKYEVDEAIGKLLKVPKVKVAVIFSLGTVAYTFLSAIKSMGLELNITWIGSDGWGGSSLYKSRGLGNITVGSIFLRLLYKEPRRFTDYFDGLTPETHSGSPWFNAYWQRSKAFNCSKVSDCPFPRYDNAPIINGVRALGHGLDAMLRDSCLKTKCYSPKNFTGMELTQYLYNVSFNTSDGILEFDQFGDAAGLYKIVNLQKVGEDFTFRTVGFWDPRDPSSMLQIDVDQMQFFGESRQPTFSLCRENCSRGYITVPLEEKCCFGCQACPENAIVKDSSCQECPATHWPNEDFTTCDEISPTALHWKESVIVAVVLFLCVGMALSLAVSCGLWINRNHPLVKATSRELSAVNVFGISLAFIDAFIFLGKPTTVICTLAESLLSLCFTVMLVPTLLKVVRIYRIFRAGKKSVRRPRFVGIRDQLIMTTLLISIQVMIVVIFSSLYTSKPDMLFVSSRKYYIGIYCGLGTSFLISSAYNLILITISCYYAFLARKVPSNYNESKFIGISIYSMLIITLAAIPVYSTATDILQIVTALCMALLLNAYLGLVCVYLPKLYAIYYKGDDVDVDDWRTASLSFSTRSAQVHPSVSVNVERN